MLGEKVGTEMGDDDWGSLMPGAEEGWGSGPSVPTDGWGEPPSTSVARPVRKDPPRREDDTDAAAKVDNLTTKVIAGKKKLATLRAQLNEIDKKRQALESEIDALMPVLQDLRSRKGAVMGQLQAGRLPQVWMEKARDLNSRRRFASINDMPRTTLAQLCDRVICAAGPFRVGARLRQSSIARSKILNIR